MLGDRKALGAGAGSGDLGTSWTRALAGGQEGAGTYRTTGPPSQPVTRGGKCRGPGRESGHKEAFNRRSGVSTRSHSLLSGIKALRSTARPPWTLQPVSTTRAEQVEQRGRAGETLGSISKLSTVARLGWAQGHVSCVTNPKPPRGLSTAQRAEQDAAEACTRGFLL